MIYIYNTVLFNNVFSMCLKYGEEPNDKDSFNNIEYEQENYILLFSMCLYFQGLRKPELSRAACLIVYVVVFVAIVLLVIAGLYTVTLVEALA